jgi:hypothetical protein
MTGRWRRNCGTACTTYIARYDHNFGARDTLTVRYGWGSQNLLEPFAQETTMCRASATTPINSGHKHRRPASAGVWSTSVVQTTRLAYNRSSRNSRPFNNDTNVGALWGRELAQRRPAQLRVSDDQGHRLLASG